MDNLKKLINSSEYNNEFSQKLLSFENYFTDIYKVCKNSFEIGCGSYLFDGQNYKYQIETYQKQKFGLEGELFKKRKELVKPIQDKVFAEIKEMATRNNYAIIFDVAGQSNILYSDPKYDKSEELIRKLK